MHTIQLYTSERIEIDSEKDQSLVTLEVTTNNIKLMLGDVEPDTLIDYVFDEHYEKVESLVLENRERNYDE